MSDRPNILYLHSHAGPVPRGVLAAMRGRLETYDPLLEEHVEPPPGAVVNDRDARSASDPHGVLR